MIKVTNRVDRQYDTLFEGLYMGKYFKMEVSNCCNEIAIEYELYGGDFDEDECEYLANLLVDLL